MNPAWSHSLEGRPGDQLGWGFALSLGFHLFLVALALVWPSLNFGRRELYAPSYQVNLVGAPGLPPGPAPAPAAKAPAPKAPAPPAPKPPEPAPAPKPEPRPAPVAKPEPKPAPKPEPIPKEAIGNKETAKEPPKRLERPPAENPQADTKLLENRLKQLESQARQDRSLDDALARLQSRVQSRVAARNQAEAVGGTGGGGGGGGGADMKYAAYYNELWERIRKQWVLPEALVQSTQGLATVVVMRLSREGALERAYLEQGSGNARYDQSCLRAVEKAAPFPPLPAGMGRGSQEIGVRFRADDLGA